VNGRCVPERDTSMTL